ncbi:MAG: TetR/AcrR family transcriptional regulator [Parvularculaceae bacterium]
MAESQGVQQIEIIDEKEAAIVEAARKTFLAKGFEGASMDAIALTANVSKRTVYNRFRSKEELFAAAIMETCRRLVPADVDDIEANLAPPEFIRQMAQQFIRGILTPEALALRRIATFEATRKPELGSTYLDHGPRWMAKSYAPILERLTARGALKIEDAKTAIWQLGALITEPLYTEALLGETPPDLEAAIDRQVESGLKAFWKIYGA